MLTMNSKWIVLAFISCVCLNLNAQESTSSSLGNGIVNLSNKDSTLTMKLSGRMQFLVNASFPENQPNESSVSIRRARLKINGFAYSPKLQYELYLGFSNSDMDGASEFTANTPRFILDAVIKWKFHENFELWFGQMKLPGNRGTVISSGSLQFVDRSLLSSNFGIGRDLGLQLHHQSHLSQTVILKEIISIAQGEGRNVSTGNLGGYQYTARVELLPLGDFKKNGDYKEADLERESSPKLAIATSYAFNNKAVKTKGNQGTYMTNDIGFHETDISTLFVDAMFKYQGFSMMAEYSIRNADDPNAKNSDLTLTGDSVKTGTAFNLQTGYLFKNNWEISARYTNVQLQKSMPSNLDENQYTLGVSKYIVGNNLKVQTDISHLEVKNGGNEILWRLQFNINF